MIELVRFRDEYRLQVGAAVVGSEEYQGSDVLCLGDEVCERIGADRDSVGYVFFTRGAAAAACSRIANEVYRYRHGQ